MECLEVRESGRALKVQTDNPHLVSIGSGRLSTNVTWHPLPEGKVTLGSSQSADIVVQGTGVEGRHCIIENSSNVVTMYPLAEMTTIDGLPVTSPTRLSQGNMICIGRSNYLRFNHPAEANLMKKFLPNTRISMAAPLNFFGSGEGTFERKPPVAPPQRRSREGWGDASEDPKPTKYEYLLPECKISPKVFPPGSTTVNSPASAVLGHSRIPNGLLAAAAQDRGRATGKSSPDTDVVDFIEAPVPQPISSYPQKATISYSQPQNQILQNGYGNPLFAGYVCDSHNSSHGDVSPVKSPAILSMPSPAFNRNPLPYMPDRLRSGTPNAAPSPSGYGLRSVTPSPASARTDPDLMSRSYDSSLTPSYASNLDGFTARKEELELRMIQAQEERKREQEAQLLEKQRLEEILTMCAEYERQAQSERQTKLPTTPTLQQNRIKTNGSLPRDKRNNGLPSPIGNSNSEDELSQIFTFESKSLPRSKVQSQDGVRGRLKIENTVASRSPYENLSKVTGREEDGLDVSRPGNEALISRHMYVENAIIKPQSSPEEEKSLLGSSSQHQHQPQSPRTRIRTTVREPSPKDQIEAANQLAILSDYDTVDPVRLRNTSPNIQRRKFLTPSQQLSQFSDLNCLVAEGRRASSSSSTRVANGDAADLNDLMKRLEMEFTSSLSELRHSAKERDSAYDKKDDASDELNNDLPESERDIACVEYDGERNDSTESSKEVTSSENATPNRKATTESFMRQKKKKKKRRRRESNEEEDEDEEVNEDEDDDNGEDADANRMKVEKATLMGIITRLKSEINAVEQQEEEILREIKMEAALVNAEYVAQKEKHGLDEDKLSGLRDKQRQLDMEIDQCKARDSELQRSCNGRIEELKREIENAEASLGRNTEFSEEYKNLVEKLEAEKKSFEDLEFKQLEEEANWLATKDDLQREIFDTSVRLETRKVRLSELASQLREMERTSQTESGNLEAQKIKLLRELEEARTKLKELDVRLSAEHDSGQYDSSEMDETSGSCKARPKSKQSQEDLVRISKVTSDAPMDIGKTGSLGRKTVESLKEIERMRQMHLAKQGSQVIEEERKRVEQLKRRVQDEVRAQWEQTRQRECNSLNSVGSEESSLTYSDQPTESASSDDVDKALTPTMAPNHPDMNGQESPDDKEGIEEGHSQEPRPNFLSAKDSLSQMFPVDREKLRAKDQDGSDFRNSRPISDYSFSDYEQQVVVKKRDAKPIRLLQQRPLTRYLPIRSESLNLRQHIDSAGHQVELCQHVSIDATSCRGFLHKLGGKFHHWNKRWFVFDRTRRTLMYYADKTEKKHRGGTYFQAIEEVYVDHLNSVKSPQPHLTFVIKTQERTYHLMAPSPEAMRIWVDVIFTGAEGYQEFEHGS